MARLKRVGRDDLTVRRQRHGRGFLYVDGERRMVRDAALAARIRGLAIPPAWTEVRIAPDPRAHIQACGTDAAGRLQYIYHPAWEARRTLKKQRQLGLLTTALPRIRRRVRDDLKAETGSKTLALALGVALIDRTAMRVGRERYLDSNGTRGAGTLFTRDVAVQGDVVSITFPAKSGRRATYALSDAGLVRAIEAVKAIPGKRLLMYRDGGGIARAVRTEDINRYLKETAGVTVTAKDFRTLHASAMAGEALATLDPGGSAAARKRQMAAVTRLVAEFLQNTPAICRASYIAPCLYALFEKRRLAGLWAGGGDGGNGLKQREARLAAVLAATG